MRFKMKTMKYAEVTRPDHPMASLVWSVDGGSNASDMVMCRLCCGLRKNNDEFVLYQRLLLLQHLTLLHFIQYSTVQYMLLDRGGGARGKKILKIYTIENEKRDRQRGPLLSVHHIIHV